MDIPGPNERPVGIGFESQEGDCGLQESRRALGWNSGIVDILLRGGIRLLESYSMEDEGYFAALIRMYKRSLEIVSSLAPAQRMIYLERLDKLRSRGTNVGWAIEEGLDSLWYAAALDERQGE
ncbi:hypothetical protein [Bradyrhizobium valentinum]|uniref:hypothetical protein n=1 Tax=Bradyrhizobium valentinum TaxID=1518501 RepID=UPI0018D26879|nr:hypothetical protein [Bradyrhizobium valentinum]